ncbi:TetR/AcrR family transcriptional regulator [Actinomyces sp. 2119]|uniref:TetR/AcrR family transcriptional regulator n=1 Tax=Actinomyces sp. 2119 TaxID=2321393 RepID=UPI000E6C98F2|nr:TetR/AcrR family transcriptional regulator [Actinomyces sp. 2119]RJF41173.1 TetR/AcrR family transcriptional regulator [Actinomyces sp. 2119]
MVGYQRAYSAEHKAERLEEIKAAADHLLTTRGLHQVTLAAVAKELGWSRGNLYRYAQTKEEIFLALYRDHSAAYVHALADAFAQQSRTYALPLPVAVFAHRWAEVTDRHHGYLRYQALLTSVIETNVPVDVLTAFKRDLEEEVQGAVAVVRRQVPGLGPEAASAAYRALLYHAAALHSHLHGAPTQLQAMEAAGTPLPKGGLAGELADFVETYLTGLTQLLPQ